MMPGPFGGPVRLLLLLFLAGCAAQRPAAVAFPGSIGDFAQDAEAGPPVDTATGQSAVYVMDAGDPVTATVRIGEPPGQDSLLPALDLGGDGLSAAMAKVEAGIKRFYPGAKLIFDEPLYLMRDGALQAGEHQTWQYRDQFLGQDRLVAMDVVINCCTNQGRLVSVWFRHRADHPIDGDMLAFLNELPWN